eukprot:30889-Pelagococcus_subviridis.AAC.1
MSCVRSGCGVRAGNAPPRRFVVAFHEISRGRNAPERRNGRNSDRARNETVFLLFDRIRDYDGKSRSDKERSLAAGTRADAARRERAITS